MLDIKWIAENKDFVKKCLKMRRHEPSVIDIVINEDNKRRKIVHKQEQFRAKRNQITKEISQRRKKNENSDELMKESKENNKKIAEIEKSLEKIEAIIYDHLLRIPNILDSSVPEGKNESDNVEISKHGTAPSFAYTPKDHHDIGENLKIIDFKRSSRLVGSRFCSLIGKGAKLNRAIKDFMLELQTEKHGYTEILPPFMANSHSFVGTSQLPKFHEDQFKVQDTDYYLIPTGEVSVTNFHREEVLSEVDLPIRYVAYTPCFRKEAGSYGKDTRGMIRQHQFEKVELVLFSHPSMSGEMHEALVSHAEKVLSCLELHYRKVQICSGDIGFGGAKQYDLEVWLPSQNKYREISSCSNFFDYQARRANIRFRPQAGGKPCFVHTLNGSGGAVGRTFLAILENYQQEDGSVLVPKVLQKYTGFNRIEKVSS